MKKLLYFLLLTGFFSCDNGKNDIILPDSSGRTHNIMLIMENKDWRSEVGDSLRKYLAVDYNDLPQAEPLFSIRQVSPDLYNGIFLTLRNLLIIKKGSKTGIRIKRNVRANPQMIAIIEGRDNEEIKQIISKHIGELIDKFKASEIKNLQRLHRKSLRDNSDVEKELDISIEIPDFFNLVDHQKDFFWFRRDVKNGEQDILLYQIPIKDSLDLQGRNVLKYRDSIGKHFIPGPADGTYMKTKMTFSPSQQILQIDGMKALESRGLWNMKKDFMAGPYINYTIFDTENKRMIVAEGFIYAPSIDKRDYIVQLEAILKTVKNKKN